VATCLPIRILETAHMSQYVALVRPEVEYASVPWKNLTLADSNKLRNVQKKSANLCYGRFGNVDFS
jgi:hypothetical protein